MLTLLSVIGTITVNVPQARNEKTKPCHQNKLLAKKYIIDCHNLLTTHKYRNHLIGKIPKIV